MKHLILSVIAFLIVPNVESVEVWGEKKLDVEIEKRFKNRDKPREHTIDPYRVKRMDMKIKYRDKTKVECKKKNFDSFQKEYDCLSDGMDKWYEENPDRGTVEYGDKFYAKLSKAEAKKKLKDLIELMDVVSFNPRTPKSEPVELTVDLLHSETMYIERYVLKVNPKDYRPFK